MSPPCWQLGCGRRAQQSWCWGAERVEAAFRGPGSVGPSSPTPVAGLSPSRGGPLGGGRGPARGLPRGSSSAAAALAACNQGTPALRTPQPRICLPWGPAWCRCGLASTSSAAALSPEEQTSVGGRCTHPPWTQPSATQPMLPSPQGWQAVAVPVLPPWISYAEKERKFIEAIIFSQSGEQAISRQGGRRARCAAGSPSPSSLRAPAPVPQTMLAPGQEN